MRTDAGLVDDGHHSTVGRYRQTLMRRAGSLSLLCALERPVRTKGLRY